MAEFLELIGPEALINFLQNWPFVVVTIGFMWWVLRQLKACYEGQQAVLKRLLDDKLGEE